MLRWNQYDHAIHINLSDLQVKREMWPWGMDVLIKIAFKHTVPNVEFFIWSGVILIFYTFVRCYSFMSCFKIYTQSLKHYLLLHNNIRVLKTDFLIWLLLFLFQHIETFIRCFFFKFDQFIVCKEPFLFLLNVVSFFPRNKKKRVCFAYKRQRIRMRCTKVIG